MSSELFSSWVNVERGLSTTLPDDIDITNVSLLKKCLHVYTNMSSNQPMKLLAKEGATLVLIRVLPTCELCLPAKSKLFKLFQDSSLHKNLDLLLSVNLDLLLSVCSEAWYLTWWGTSNKYPYLIPECETLG